MNTVLLHIPHSSTVIPHEWRSLFALDDEELRRELLAMTDWYTDELFQAGDQVDRLTFQVSRLLVDPERFEHDTEEPMARKGMGAIYTKTHDGQKLKATGHRPELMAEYYKPHHKTLDMWVRDRLIRSDRCLIIDCHSFPSLPLACDLDQTPNRPDFCIGTVQPHTPPALVQAATSVLQASGRAVGIDKPYSGSIVPTRFLGREPRVGSIMIEVNRKLYMDERTGSKSEQFGETGDLVARVLESIIAAWVQEV